MIIKRVMVSQRNKMILEQLTKRKITEDEIAKFDETMGELMQSPMNVLTTTNELSDPFLKIQSARQEVLERQKLAHLTPYTLYESNEITTCDKIISAEADRTNVKASGFTCKLF